MAEAQVLRRRQISSAASGSALTRANGVVSIAVEAVRLEVDLSHLLVGDHRTLDDARFRLPA
jgi:hypothetical protein